MPVKQRYWSHYAWSLAGRSAGGQQWFDGDRPDIDRDTTHRTVLRTRAYVSAIGWQDEVASIPEPLHRANDATARVLQPWYSVQLGNGTESDFPGAGLFSFDNPVFFPTPGLFDGFLTPVIMSPLQWQPPVYVPPITVGPDTRSESWYVSLTGDATSGDSEGSRAFAPGEQIGVLVAFAQDANLSSGSDHGPEVFFWSGIVSLLVEWYTP